MKEFNPKICVHCGGTKFRRFKKLEFDERMIAEKRMGEKLEEITPDSVFCTRCFVPIRNPEEQT